MKTVAAVIAVTLAVALQPAQAAAPTVNARVAKLERQVKRLNTDMYKCLGDTVNVVMDEDMRLTVDRNEADYVLLVVNPKCVH